MWSTKGGWSLNMNTAQVVSLAIMGVGAVERVKKIPQGVAQEIATAWLLTIPATDLRAAALWWVLSRFTVLIFYRVVIH